jgi:hypothetical protein
LYLYQEARNDDDLSDRIDVYYVTVLSLSRNRNEDQWRKVGESRPLSAPLYLRGITEGQEIVRLHNWRINIARNIYYYTLKRRSVTRKRGRYGLIFLLALAISLVGAVKLSAPQIPAPVEVKEVEMKTSMAEKRENRRITKLYARSGWGWNQREWECLNALWSSESRFDHRAANPRSTAFGVAQVLKEKDHRPRVQILRGLRYIAHRYDTPCKAWGFWLRNFYY